MSRVVNAVKSVVAKIKYRGFNGYPGGTAKMKANRLRTAHALRRKRSTTEGRLALRKQVKKYV